jgi:3-dehydroquinate synthase
MTDSSVGGKTAVNLDSGKNQAGAFYQPDLVLCDYATLDTLPRENYRDGCAEIIKHAIIRDAELFELLKQPIDDNIGEIIARNVAIKRDVVALDERDTGIRQILNFGHTVGHGIEKCSDYKISHGSAVAIGMVIESRISACNAEILDMVKRHELPFSTDISAEKLVHASLSDKKRSGDKIAMIFVDKIGDCSLKYISMNEYSDIVHKGVSL